MKVEVNNNLKVTLHVFSLTFYIDNPEVQFTKLF